ncbi:MAG TPA: archease [Thermoleophilia bacterium]|nr:archease [Thermoleophilia bacterium]
MTTGFTLIDHTADVGVRAWGGSEEAVFEEAAKGMFSLVCDPGTVARLERLEVSVEAASADHELLLVAWLNELLYLFEARRILFSGFRIIELGESGLMAEVTGETMGPQHAVCGGVKAATYHGLKLTHTGEGWEAEVILDV